MTEINKDEEAKNITLIFKKQVDSEFMKKLNQLQPSYSDDKKTLTIVAKGKQGFDLILRALNKI